MADENKIIRDYYDNISVKEMVEDTLVPTYFDDEDISDRTIGMIGYTSELISNTTEDSLNTASVLFRESFANRAQLKESIYSHAAIFQISDVFAKAATCNFLLVIEEAEVIRNMTQSAPASSIYNFFIDKGTIIYVEEIPYTLDYDIKLNIVKKITERGDDYIFTAQYILDEYQYGNSISDIKDPYIKLRRSSDGFIALDVVTHQCIRDVRYETIISNSIINYPTIDITNFNGKLAGFEVLYKDPSGKYAPDEPVQMKTQILYSSPLHTPFCYYQLLNSDTLRITFNTRDLYFMPEFNSELTIILYITEGSDGNFDVYNGNNITLVPSTEKYSYSTNYLTAAKPIGSSGGGRNNTSLTALQDLAVEGYRTANALTTDHDLQEFFNNFKYRYSDDEILFIKKRDDVYERVFAAFFVMKNNDYIYKTNTLRLRLNLYDMSNPEKDVFILEPGLLFTANTVDGYAEFLRDSSKETRYRALYDTAVERGETDFLPSSVDPSEVPDYLKRPCSFAQFKARNGYDDKMYVFDLPESRYSYYDHHNTGTGNSFLLLNPFLLRFTKNPNLVCTYMTYVNNVCLLDFTNQNEDEYVQFIANTVSVHRGFSRSKRYEIKLNIQPSVNIDIETPIIATKTVGEETEYVLNDKYSVLNNDLRIFMVVNDNDGNQICYTELYPYEVTESNVFRFKGSMLTDDHITSNGYLRILKEEIYRNYSNGEYYKVHDDDATLYGKYNNKDELIQDNIPVDTVTQLIEAGTVKKYSTTINMRNADDIKIPIDEVTCTIYTLYRRHIDESTGKLVLNTDDMGNNPFRQINDTLKNYVWTNEYNTGVEPITFIKPLNSVRTYLSFEDYTEKDSSDAYAHDIYDVQLYNIGFLRASTYLDEDRMNYFMTSFLANYNYITDIINISLRNATNIDVKFYNTYGVSRNFVLGEDNYPLTTVNLTISFDMWFVVGTDTTVVVPEVKAYIKEEIESINKNNMNNLFISNLMRKIETRFAYVDHIRFVSINGRSSTFQAVKNRTADLNDLTVEERRFYVPELLVCDLDDITITEYFAQ